MSHSSNSEENKVVSLFAARIKQSEEKVAEARKESAIESFNKVIQKNKEVADRMKKEREKSNRSVLKSYRIKN